MIKRGGDLIQLRQILADPSIPLVVLVRPARINFRRLWIFTERVSDVARNFVCAGKFKSRLVPQGSDEIPGGRGVQRGIRRNRTTQRGFGRIELKNRVRQAGFSSR